jgi:polo-like kinase 1
VQRWVDYSDKYGIGYRLTTGEVGALFNDQTSIRYLDDKTFSYLDPNPGHTNLSGTYTFQDFPKPLTKKSKLLKRFKAFLTLSDPPPDTPSYLTSP